MTGVAVPAGFSASIVAIEARTHGPVSIVSGRPVQKRVAASVLCPAPSAIITITFFGMSAAIAGVAVASSKAVTNARMVSPQNVAGTIVPHM